MPAPERQSANSHTPFIPRGRREKEHSWQLSFEVQRIPVTSERQCNVHGSIIHRPCHMLRQGMVWTKMHWLMLLNVSATIIQL